MQATWSDNLSTTPLPPPFAPDADLLELSGLENEAVPVRLGAHERLLPERDGPTAVWLVQHGLLGLTYGDAEGRDATVLMLGPGDFFGRLSDEYGFEYGQSAVALRPAGYALGLTTAQLSAGLWASCQSRKRGPSASATG